MKKILFQGLGVFLLVLAVGCGEESKTIFTENDINIVPKPLEMKLNQGAFRFTKDTKLVAANDQTRVFEVLQNKFVSAALFMQVAIMDFCMVWKPLDNYFQSP